MATATLSRNGRITLPKEVREHLHLVEGDRLEFVIRSDGAVQVQPVTGSYKDLRGMVRRPGRSSPSDDDLDREVLRLLSEDDERIRNGRA
jgi:antitoxin PrlF